MASILQVLSVILKKPAVAATLGAILGLVFGWFVIGWWLWPVQWTDGTPEVLRSDLRADYLRMAVDSFRVNGDQAQAVRRWDELGANAASALEMVKQDPRGLDPVSISNFEQLIAAAKGSLEANAPPDGETQSSSFRTILISVAGILILAVIVFGVLYFLRNIFRPRSGTVSAAMQAAEASRHTEKTDFQSLGLAPPVTQMMTTYVLGDDLYDESFSIDTQGGDFLGEYGVGISETIGVGDPKKVTALEVWLFDKNDIKTATKVLMSSHAYNDPNLRARLEAKGELVMLAPQEQIILETATLQLLVTVSDLEYGVGALPPESYFERVTLELAIWPKEG
ncbi:MAG: hypothetical protein JW963_18635 [Anaerolineales bacterium]|nr:hypothetical protein [Anaerolineales bacterium]